ncbi:hypothetical protein BG006_004148 [Podila minutissima]|uniref:Major facilitator superfamily (MFS) profile domain-containing protein n=1 Tax=Podila minutissima TaxID=64525 RepID=A0A9P5SX85_9FUNG|nr:hypothetical protein BG006_004148 [Podila minutissima]
MDPSLQEFYCISRSASQQRPFSQIITTSQRPSSRTSSRHPSTAHTRERPASASAHAWSNYHPLSVPSIAQISMQQPLSLSENVQDAFNDRGGRRRHHTAGNADHFPQCDFGATLRNTSADDPLQSDPLQSYRQPQSSYRSSTCSNFRPNDPYALDDDGAPNPDFSREEQLEDLDGFGRHSSGQEADQQRPINCGDTGDEEGDEGAPFTGQDHLMYDSSDAYDSNSVPTKPTPLPKVPLFVLSVVIFSEPLTSTILFPFVDFGITENEDEIGFFCGLIASSFFFAQFCTSIFWGYMSDRYGRRPILLLGLIGSTIASLFFGLSKSLAWAIVSRSMCGLLNGNVGVAKSMLGEIADPSNQSQAFGVFGFAWGIGMIVGPVLGGYLANPAKNFPETFGDWQFFIEYPYFLPCLVAASGGVIGFIVGYFFLEETRGKKKHNIAGGDIQGNSRDDRDFVIKYATECPSIDTLNYSAEDVQDANNDIDAHLTNLKPRPSVSISGNDGPLSLNELDLERQPLMLPPSAPQPQIKFTDRRISQYGSMATLATEPNISPTPSPYAEPPRQFSTVSARSTLSRSTAPSRPRVVRHDRQDSATDYRSSYQHFERPRSAAGQHSIYSYSRPLSSGGLLSTADSITYRQIESIPADAQSLSFYGYIADPSLDSSHGIRGLEAGQRGRMSQATSQIFLLPPDPANKDPNAPMQLLVVQTEAGLSPLSITTIVAYSMLALHSIVFEEVYTLFAVTPLASHGLGWNAMQLSTSLASMGLVQLFLQFVLYPKLERRFSAVWLFRCAQLLYTCIYLTFPMIRAFLTDENEPETGGQIARVRYTVLLVLVFKYLCSVLSYTSVMLMINNSSPPHLLGTVNGIGQTSASFMRAFGPALGGILWAWSLSNKLSFPFNYFFVFFMMGTIAILGFIHSFSIPRDLGQKRL